MTTHLMPLKNLSFVSNDYTIYQDGKDISGHCYGFWRKIRVINHDDQFSVTIHKLDPRYHLRPGKRVVAAAPLSAVKCTNTTIVLSGSDDTFILSLHNDKVKAINWLNGSRDVLYLKAPTTKMEKIVDVPLQSHIEEMDKKCRNVLIEKYNEIVSRVELNDEMMVKQATADYYLTLGMLQFKRELYREAKEALIQCNMTLVFAGLMPGPDAVWWFAKVSETEGNFEEARNFYELALKRQAQW